MPRKRTYTKKQLEKKITKTANDIGLLIDNKYVISEIIDSIIIHSDVQVKQIMVQILKAQEILDGLGVESLYKKVDDLETASDSEKTDNTGKWDL